MPQANDMTNSPNNISWRICLGRAGKTPGLDILDCVIRQIIAVWSCVKSVYAILAGRKWVAVGDRGGGITLFPPLSTLESGGTLDVKTVRTCGGQVTALAETSNGALVAADTEDAFLWPDPLKRPDFFVTLNTRSRMVCALSSCMGRIFGLAWTGYLFIWHDSTGDLISCTSVPKPGPKAALSSLVFYEPTASLVYLASDGELVRYSVETGAVSKVKAHDGEAYLAMLSAKHLITVGRNDGRLIRWKNDLSAPEDIFEIPRGTVVGACFPGIYPSFVLINENGHAAMWELRHGHSEMLQDLGDNSFRSVTTFSPDELKSAEHDCRQAEIRRIAEALVADRGGMAESQRGTLYQQLKELGAEGISLEIQAQKAAERASDDPAARLRELHIRHCQQALLQDTPDSVPILRRTGDVYVRFKLFVEAHRCLQRTGCLVMTQSQVLSTEDAWIQEAADAVVGKTAIIDFDDECPLNEHVDAHDAIGKEASGHFIIGNMDPIPWTGGHIQAEVVLDVLKTTWSEIAPDWSPIPKFEVVHLAWTACSHVDHRLVLFAKSSLDLGGPVLSLAIPLLAGASELPVVVVLATNGVSANSLESCEHSSPGGASTEDRNNVLRKAFFQVTRESGANAWLKSAWKVFGKTFTRISVMQRLTP